MAAGRLSSALLGFVALALLATFGAAHSNEKAACSANIGAAIRRASQAASGMLDEEGLLAVVAQSLSTEACECQMALEHAQWRPSPAWSSGLIASLVRQSMDKNRYLRVDLDPMPSPSNSSNSIRSLSSVDMNNLPTLWTTDMSGMSVTTIKDQVGAWCFAFPENSCQVASQASGMLHPRSYLLTFYRLDALEAMAAAGVLSSAAAPNDWEELLDLLEAHKAARQRPGLQLPSHGLCLTTSPSCGTLGHVLSAIAGTVLQTKGMGQGSVLDLTLPPPSAELLVDSAGWRYAAELLTRLLAYNAPDGDLGGTSSDDLQGCDAISPHFASGDCLLTIEWDPAVYLMPSLMTRELLAPGMVGIAPLPGSRIVMARSNCTTGPAGPSAAAAGPSASTGPSSLDPGTQAGIVPVNNGAEADPDGDDEHEWSDGGGGELVPCTEALCSISANHDLLYLTPQGLGDWTSFTTASALSAPPDATWVGDVCGLLVTTRVEAMAAERQRLNTGVSTPANTGSAASAAQGANADPAAPAAASSGQRRIVNRAPYSALFSTLAYNKLPEFGPISKTLVQIMHARQAITDKARDAIGFKSLPLPPDFNKSGTVAKAPPLTWDGAAFARYPWWAAPDSAFNVTPLTAQGLDPVMALSYIRAVWHGIHHPNQAPSLLAPSSQNLFSWVLAHVARSLVPPVSDPAQFSNVSGAIAPAARAASATTTIKTLFKTLLKEYGYITVRYWYCDAIGAAFWPLQFAITATGTADADGSSHAGGLQRPVLAAIVACSALAALAALVAAFLLMRSARPNVDLLGRVRAPRLGPDTTLLITDIQNSTVLWEALSPGCMEQAIRLHHTTIRRLLAKHGGYESATEGDSFIVAFASVASAAAFAAACQLELMEQDWPAELLAHPDGNVVLAEPPRVESAALAHRFSTASSDLNTSSQRTGSPTPHHAHGAGMLTAAALGIGVTSSQRLLSFLGFSRSSSSSNLISGGRPAVAQAIDSHADSVCSGDSPLPTPCASAKAIPHAAGAFAASPRPWISRKFLGSGGGSVPPYPVSASAAPSPPPEPADGTLGSPHARASLDASVRSVLHNSSETAGSTQSHLPKAWREAFLESLSTPASRPRSSSRLRNVAGSGKGFGGTLCKAADGSCLMLDGRPVVLRGLRVRMGLSSGLQDPAHMVFNRVASSVKYYGPLLEAAKAVGDAAPGGGILLSASAFARLGAGRQAPKARGLARLLPFLRASSPADAPKQQKCSLVVVYAGHHLLDAVDSRPPNTGPGTGPGTGPAGPSARASLSRHASNMLLNAGPHVLLKVGNCDDEDDDDFATPEAVSPTVVAAGRAHSSLLGPAPLARPGSAVNIASACLFTLANAVQMPEAGTPVYLAAPAGMLWRLAHPRLSIRSHGVTQLGTLSAPVGTVAVAFMRVTGASTLLADLPGPAGRGLEQLSGLVCGLLGQWGGYLAEGGDGLFLAVFGSPAAAIEWALECEEKLKWLDWDPELLAHELAEEVATYGSVHPVRTPEVRPGKPVRRGSSALDASMLRSISFKHQVLPATSYMAASPAEYMETGGEREGSARGLPYMQARKVLYRGLRIKVGIDVGHTSSALVEASGRLSYRGKAMNRASRITGLAAAGQVLASGGAMAACEAVEGGRAGALGFSREVVGVSLGAQSLKGVTGPVEVVHCYFAEE
ncbi:hypothetical protein HYH03_009462 [Edaphochlamys debaryana]|uniref:Guanylate cyclase domain-containing protein n=1 Tax=Edaphochlamys debaryana TaxID=47281 RepID=A0A835XZ05_9CHLO|nr:hypothetical protein HYH03_009462 [Edaphochlamys debaryana]|eukprot:KAG2492217.1 hypothetical protein HYH03_009462 [Edaphochlamys debaryana]